MAVRAIEVGGILPNLIDAAIMLPEAAAVVAAA